MKKSEIRVGIIERTLDFAVQIVQLANTLPKTPAGFALASQLVRAGTSIGANLQEAKSASSRRDFIHCNVISLKESRETMYWLTILEKTEIISSEKLELLLKESDEIIRILVTIVKNSKINSDLLAQTSKLI